MKKVICFGGSFNPPHSAHFKIAKQALKASQSDECWFIPSLDNPFKKDESNFEKRAQLVEAMIKGFRKFKVSRIESELPSPSYTIQTICELQKRYPDISFSYLIGSDQALKFDDWKDSKKLKELLPIYVYRRQKEDKIDESFIEIKTDIIFDASSTDVRNGQLDDVSYNVLKKMIEFEMHCESIVKNLVSAKRFKHIKAMTELALRIGQAHHLDAHQIYIAALFHDCAKSLSLEKMRERLAIIDPDYLHKPEYMWHARCGADYVKTRLHVYDKEILKAITHHVEGMSDDKLVQVIYIADKCDETRDYDASKFIELATKDLNRAYLAVKENTLKYHSEGSQN